MIAVTVLVKDISCFPHGHHQRPGKEQLKGWRMVHHLKVQTALPGDPSLFPTPTMGISQPCNSSSRNLASTSGLSGHLYSPEHTHTCTHTHTFKSIVLRGDLREEGGIWAPSLSGTVHHGGKSSHPTEGWL